MVGQKPGKNEGVKQGDVKTDVKMEVKNTGNQKNEERKNDHGSGAHQHGPGPRRGQYRNRHDRKQQHHQHGHSQDQHHEMNLDQTMDLEQMGAQASERKFTGRCRLFVGNLTNDIGENEFKKMFEQYGEFSEVFINPSRGFGFIKMDTRANAEIAKAALDGQQRKGRVLRVRFATHGAALRVKYLPSHVSNELLEQAFSQFGDVERAIVIVDDRGRPTGEGIVEFARKPGAQQALSRINDGVFILGTTPRPVIVEPLDQKDEEDGYPEKFVPKNQQILKEREQQPRFAPPGSFEFEFAQKWKDLYQMEVQQKEQLKRQMEEAATKVDLEMESAQHEHQTMLLRQDLLRRQEELRRLEEQHQNDLQRKMEMRRQEEEMRIQNEERRRQEIIMRQQQEEEIRRRQMDRGGRGGGSGGGGDDFFGQERSMRDMGRDRGNAPPMQPPPAPPASLGLDRPRNSGMGGPGMGNQGGPGGMNNLSGHGGPGGMSGSGMEGMGMNQQPTRQSRFDQPPQTMGGFGNMGGGGPGGNMGGGGPGNMGNMGGPGGNMMGGGGMGNSNMNSGPGGMSRGHGPMNNERMMDRREREDFFESKRPRRF